MFWNTFWVAPFWDHFFYWVIFDFGLGVGLHGIWNMIGELRDRFVITMRRSCQPSRARSLRQMGLLRARAW
jgi:hypothetical protein